MNEEKYLLDALRCVLFEEQPVRGRKYSDDVVENFIVACVLSSIESHPTRRLSPPEEALLEGFCRRIGISADLSPEAAVAQSAAYLAAHPPPLDLKNELHEISQRFLTQRSENRGRRGAALLGLVRSSFDIMEV